MSRDRPPGGQKQYMFAQSANVTISTSIYPKFEKKLLHKEKIIIKGKPQKGDTRDV